MTKSIGSGAARATGGAATIETVADIVVRELEAVIADWLARVEQEPDLTSIPLNFEERTGLGCGRPHPKPPRSGLGQRSDGTD